MIVVSEVAESSRGTSPGIIVRKRETLTNKSPTKIIVARMPIMLRHQVVVPTITVNATKNHPMNRVAVPTTTRVAIGGIMTRVRRIPIRRRVNMTGMTETNVIRVFPTMGVLRTMNDDATTRKMRNPSGLVRDQHRNWKPLTCTGLMVQ